MVPLSIPHATQITQTTNINLKMGSPLLLGQAAPRVFQLFPTQSEWFPENVIWKAFICRTPKFRRRKPSEDLITGL